MTRTLAFCTGSVSFVIGVIAGLAMIGCGGAARAVQMTPQAQSVQTGTDDPPPGMREIGPVEAVHGHGCGSHGREGQYESAYAELRNTAASRGATYVKIVQMIEPHSENPRCYDQRFIIRGLAYAPGEATSEAQQAPEATNNCNPPCSPGYECQAGVCVALCNPPCSPGYECANDRTCQPVALSPFDESSSAASQ